MNGFRKSMVLWVQAIAFLKYWNSAIKVVSYGLHSQKQCIIIPSVGGSSSKQVYRFFICLRGVFDCVCEKVDARNSVQFAMFSLQKIVL